MTMKELVDAISKRSGLAKNDSEQALKAVFGSISELLSRGDSIVIKDFGSLSVKDRAARTGRNPSTGQPLHIPASRVVSFKTSSKLKDTINA